MVTPIEVASNGSTKLELRPIATQLPAQTLSRVPASNFIFLPILIFI